MEFAFDFVSSKTEKKTHRMSAQLTPPSTLDTTQLGSIPEKASELNQILHTFHEKLAVWKHSIPNRDQDRVILQALQENRDLGLDISDLVFLLTQISYTCQECGIEYWRNLKFGNNS